MYRGQGVEVLGVNHYGLDTDNEVGMLDFQSDTGASFPLGNDLTGSYAPLRSAAPGSSNNGVHVVVDRDGRISHFSRSYDEAAIVGELDRLLSLP